MGVPVRIELASELTNNEVSRSDLESIAAAYTLHVHAGLSRAWPNVVLADVAVVDALKVGQSGAYPIMVVGMGQMPAGAGGFHLDRHKQPQAIVGYDPSARDQLSVTVSHEGDEMLVDPTGNRLVTCPLHVPGEAQPRVVKVLVEVSDACEARSYPLNGVDLTDSCTPLFYGTHHWHGIPSGPPQVAGLTLMGTISTPLTVLPGGYLSFVDPRTHVWQQITAFGEDGQPQVRTLGRRDEASGLSHREWVDGQTAHLSRGHVGRVAHARAQSLGVGAQWKHGAMFKGDVDQGAFAADAHTDAIR